MTSTVLDVTVMLLCVSASVVALGGVGGTEGGVDVRGPTADEVADRLATETVTVRYRAPGAANGTRTVHATRVELIALLVSGGRESGSGPDAVEGRRGATAFESQARDAILAGVDERTRVDATISTVTNRDDTTSEATVSRRVSDNRGEWRASGPIAVSGAANARRTGVGSDSNVQRRDADRSASKRGVTVAAGTEPPRSVDVTTAVVTHPLPGETEADGVVRIVVRRW
jgi:hypothetical protein